MDDLSQYAVDLASKMGADYSDIKISDKRSLDVEIQDGVPSNTLYSTESGFGFRALINGGWGFAGSREINKKTIKKSVEIAVRLAKTSQLKKGNKIERVKEPINTGKYNTKVILNPIEISLNEILEILVSADAEFRNSSPHTKTTFSTYQAKNENKRIVTSEGSDVEQNLCFCGVIGFGIANKNGVVEKRTYDSNYVSKGFEHIKEAKLSEKARVAASELEQLLEAKPCPREIKTTLLLDGDNLGLQIHETIGHGSELDRVLGYDAEKAGMSYLTADKKDVFNYGSEIVNFVADATVDGGLGTYGYDDEAVKGKKVNLVKNGVLVGYQTSRQTAFEIGDKESSGGTRSDSPLHFPIVRMSNVNLLPGEWKSSEIIEDTKNGILLRGAKLWSVDDLRVNFQFGTEIGWRIEKGEIKEVIRDPTYTALSYDFWRSVDAIAKDDWLIWGTAECGKGFPMQMINVGHGCSLTRVNDVRVGII